MGARSRNFGAGLAALVLGMQGCDPCTNEEKVRVQLESKPINPSLELDIFNKIPVHRDEFTVEMNEGKYVEDDGQLKTYGLLGCNAVLIYTSGPDKKRGILTHYSPLEAIANVTKIKQLVGEHPEMKDANLKRVVILYRGDSFYQGSSDQASESTLRYLESGVMVALGSNTNIEKRKYSGMLSFGEGHREAHILLKSESWTSFMGGGKFE